MRTAPQDMGFDRARQVHINWHDPHRARGLQHSLRQPTFGAPYCLDLSIETDAEKQARHRFGFQLRLLVTLPS